MSEVWKDIPGYEGKYQVSDLGRVRSLDREVIYKDGRIGSYKGQILKPRNVGNGRLGVALTKDFKRKNYKVHILVALTFIGERPKGYDVCHIDSNPLNNKLNNLRYDTRNQNNIDTYRTGESKKGMGKLTLEQVMSIRKLYQAEKYNVRELSELFKVTPENIRLIINRVSFQWLNDDGTIQESNTAVS